MSAAFYALVGVLYLGAVFACLYEGKYSYALLGLFWGGGNFVIVYQMLWPR